VAVASTRSVRHVAYWRTIRGRCRVARDTPGGFPLPPNTERKRAEGVVARLDESIIADTING
jgi:hypothetical protein